MPISPNQGSYGGGTTVTITGVNLANAIKVMFGTKSATITANTPTMITVTNPSNTGVVPVSVTTPGGQSNPLNFYYIPSPIILSLSDNYGPASGGNTISIYGLYLSTATNVSFGESSAIPTIINDGQITVTVPETSLSTAIVTVTTQGGSYAGPHYTYLNGPLVTTITPSSGSVIGSSVITIYGGALSTTQSVTFGGVAAGFIVTNDTTVTVITPAHAAGAVDVVLTTQGGSAVVSDGYVYINGPGV